MLRFCDHTQMQLQEPTGGWHQSPARAFRKQSPLMIPRQSLSRDLDVICLLVVVAPHEVYPRVKQTRCTSHWLYQHSISNVRNHLTLPPKYRTPYVSHTVQRHAITCLVFLSHELKGLPIFIISLSQVNRLLHLYRSSKHRSLPAL